MNIYILLFLSETKMYDDLEQLYRRFDSYVSVFKNYPSHGGGMSFLIKRHVCFGRSCKFDFC